MEMERPSEHRTYQPNIYGYKLKQRENSVTPICIISSILYLLWGTILIALTLFGKYTGIWEWLEIYNDYWMNFTSALVFFACGWAQLLAIFGILIVAFGLRFYNKYYLLICCSLALRSGALGGLWGWLFGNGNLKVEVMGKSTVLLCVDIIFANIVLSSALTIFQYRRGFFRFIYVLLSSLMLTILLCYFFYLLPYLLANYTQLIYDQKYVEVGFYIGFLVVSGGASLMGIFGILNGIDPYTFTFRIFNIIYASISLTLAIAMFVYFWLQNEWEQYLLIYGLVGYASPIALFLLMTIFIQTLPTVVYVGRPQYMPVVCQMIQIYK